jgi:hypothetical protein
MDSVAWVDRYEAELRRAEAARRDGNEGMARVCARRAAGLVAGEYLHRCGLQPSGSAYDRLRHLSSLPGLSEEVKEVCRHFLVRITPDHELPVEADLIVETRWLREKLLSG